MDTAEDWAERKELEKNERYGPLIGFINHLSHRERSGCKKPLKPTSPQEYEDPYAPTSSLRD